MVRKVSEHKVDMLIIGGGPAGMFAAFYAGMRQATVKILDSMPQLGGQPIALYPEKNIYDIAGFPKITAAQLTKNLIEQMSMFPVAIHLEEKVEQIIKIADGHFEVVTNKEVHLAKAIIITAGIGAFAPRKLAIEGAERFETSNLHYFVTDMQRFAGQEVIINGGGDSAVDWALMLEPIAKQVTLIHRRDNFRAHEHSVEQLKASGVRLVTPAEIIALHSDEDQARISAVTVTYNGDDRTETINCDALIINFGFLSTLGPITAWGIKMEKGSIVVDSRMETSIPGIFAAGDITTYPGKVKLIATGFGEAPTAINNAKVYVDPHAKLSPGHSSNMKL